MSAAVEVHGLDAGRCRHRITDLGAHYRPATVDKTGVYVPEVPQEHEAMARNLIKRVDGATALREFNHLVMSGYIYRRPAGAGSSTCTNCVRLQLVQVVLLQRQLQAALLWLLVLQVGQQQLSTMIMTTYSEKGSMLTRDSTVT
jgi:hypothetical protein